jgi:hypothetical protein
MEDVSAWETEWGQNESTMLAKEQVGKQLGAVQQQPELLKLMTSFHGRQSCAALAETLEHILEFVMMICLSRRGKQRLFCYSAKNPRRFAQGVI